GSFYQAHRKQQAIADAAALAAAGDLPGNTSQASSDAQTYAAKNGGSTSNISFSSTYMTNDTVTIEAKQTVPRPFLGVVGIDHGAKCNSSQVHSAMDAAVGRTLLFPGYDTTSGNRANLKYHVIGWSGFHITAWAAKGPNALITGYFAKVDWEGSGTSNPANYF